MNRNLAALAFLGCGLLALVAPAQYCTAVLTSGSCSTTGDEFIGRVAIGTLDNESWCTIAPHYTDFTNVTAPVLLPGNAYTLSVTIRQHWGTDHVRAWIDWNGNFSFADAGEEIAFAQLPCVTSGTCTTVFTQTVNVPLTAVAETRMRVVLRWNTVPIACETTGYGDAEDYTIRTVPHDFSSVSIAAPNRVPRGTNSVITLQMSSVSPPSPPVVSSATLDLSALGGSSAEPTYDDGINGGDLVAGDNVFSATVPVAPATALGLYNIPYTAVDSIARVTTGSINVVVLLDNDECIAATVIVAGSHGPFSSADGTSSNVNSTCTAAVGVKDRWYSFTPTCSDTFTISTQVASGTSLDTILEVYDACGGTVLACNDDATGSTTWSEVTLAMTGGVTHMIRVSSVSNPVGNFNVNVLAGTPLVWSSPLGPGSIQWNITGGPAFGVYLHVIGLAAGTFPNGWFFGVDIPLVDVVAQIGAGFPFSGPLDACGANQLGPVGGLPSGLPVYSVAILMTGPGLYGVTGVTNPASHVIP